MNDPATIVIFGASGDLTSRKLVPALFNLKRKGRTNPQTQIVGFSRTPMSHDQFRNHLHENAHNLLGAECNDECWRRFAETVFYCRGDITQPDDFTKLDQFLVELSAKSPSPAGRLYYLSTAPQFYAPTVVHLGQANMADESSGFRRMVIEKPFGHGLESAKTLNQEIHAVFDEKQIFRIDHYLGKETVQNILALRFANTIFEPLWNRNFVDHIQITVAEKAGVGTRGPYYDRAGVLRDMFQNHLLQLLTIVAMEPPAKFGADILRDEKVKVLKAILSESATDLINSTVRGQYEGYRDLNGVAADSVTPTFAAIRLCVHNWRWRGVPFYLRTGKELPTRVTEIIVQFHCPPHMMFDLPLGHTITCNRLVIRIQPQEGIRLVFQTKVPDQGMTLRTSDLEFLYNPSGQQAIIPEAYERLLLDAINGDASLFIRNDEIELAWSICDPIQQLWDNDPTSVHPYAPNTWGPQAANQLLIKDGRNWIEPLTDERKNGTGSFLSR